MSQLLIVIRLFKYNQGHKYYMDQCVIVNIFYAERRLCNAEFFRKLPPYIVFDKSQTFKEYRRYFAFELKVCN